MDFCHIIITGLLHGSDAKLYIVHYFGNACAFVKRRLFHCLCCFLQRIEAVFAKPFCSVKIILLLIWSNILVKILCAKQIEFYALGRIIGHFGTS